MESKKMETAIAALVSLLIGGGVGYYVAPEEVAEKELTNTDLAKEPCSVEYIDKYGQNLCRELFCRMSANKTDGKVAAQECEEISNIINSKYIFEHCSTIEEEKKQEQCFRIYEKRK